MEHTQTIDARSSSKVASFGSPLRLRPIADPVGTAIFPLMDRVIDTLVTISSSKTVATMDLQRRTIEAYSESGVAPFLGARLSPSRKAVGLNRPNRSSDSPASLSWAAAASLVRGA